MKHLRPLCFLSFPIALILMLAAAGCGGGTMGSAGTASGSTATGGTVTVRVAASANTAPRFSIAATAAQFLVDVEDPNSQLVLASAQASAATAESSGITVNNVPLGLELVVVEELDAANNVIGVFSSQVNVVAGNNIVPAALQTQFGNFSLTGTYAFALHQVGNAIVTGTPFPEFESVNGTVTFDGKNDAVIQGVQTGQITAVTANIATKINGVVTKKTNPALLNGLYSVQAGGIFSAQMTFNNGNGGQTTLNLRGSLNDNLDTVTFGSNRTDTSNVNNTEVVQGVGIIAFNQATFTNKDLPATVPFVNVGETNIVRGNLTTDSNGNITGGSALNNEANNVAIGTGTYAFNGTQLSASFQATQVNNPTTTIQLSGGTMVAGKDVALANSLDVNNNKLGFVTLILPGANQSNASLAGTYSFEQMNTVNNTGDANVGTVTFDGKGTITAGTSTSVSIGGTIKNATLTGTYQVSANGTFTATLNISNGDVVTLRGVINARNNAFAATTTDNNNGQGMTVASK